MHPVANIGCIWENKDMRKPKYTKQLAPLLRQPFITTQAAKDQGVPKNALVYLAKKGVLERVERGIYRVIHYEPLVDFEWENLAFRAAAIPGGVICLISALCYYDLTDQIMREAWIAIPHKLRAPKRPLTRIVRMRNTTLGRTDILMGEFKVAIFDRERCIVDAFRYLSKEIALKALQKYLKNKDYKPQLKKLAEYAELLRVDLTPYILSYTT
jgi:predicted transcriptional regulator of viral defense system